ncbi:MAG: hypothetical protein ACRET2_11875 [Steroidobacteraceae bacterium]
MPPDPLESIGDRYREAYLRHDPTLAPLARGVRYTENNVKMDFPDGSWDTVTQEPGPVLTCSDPATGQVGIYTTILQNDVPGFLAVRLKIERARITEVEHVLSTRRNLSGPPTPIGDAAAFTHDPDLARPVTAAERMARPQLVAAADGYFSTLENNTGEIRGAARFATDAIRKENGLEFRDIEQGFRRGYYRFNARVRDRDHFLIDEVRGLVMSRAFIDHKGVMDTYTLTDGTSRRSPFREPQTWALLELFKVKGGLITSIEATFTAAPYFMRSPWTRRPARRP